MKIKSLVFVCIVLAMVALVAVPVSGISPSSASSAAIGTIGTNQEEISIALNESSVVFTPQLSIGSNSNGTLAATVITNDPLGFTVNVADKTGRPSVQTGFMSNFTSGVYGSGTYPGTNTTLVSPLLISGTGNTTNSNTVTGTSSPVSATTGGVQLFNGPAGNWLLSTPFSQQVSTSDAILPTGSQYQIDLSFIATAL